MVWLLESFILLAIFIVYWFARLIEFSCSHIYLDVRLQAELSSRYYIPSHARDYQIVRIAHAHTDLESCNINAPNCAGTLNFSFYRPLQCDAIIAVERGKSNIADCCYWKSQWYSSCVSSQPREIFAVANVQLVAFRPNTASTNDVEAVASSTIVAFLVKCENCLIMRRKY